MAPAPGIRFAVLFSDRTGAFCSLAGGRWRSGWPRDGFVPIIRRCWGVRSDVWAGFLVRTPDEIYGWRPHLYWFFTSEVTSAGYHADEILLLARGRNAPPLVVLLSTGSGQLRQRTPGASSACISSTRSVLRF